MKQILLALLVNLQNPKLWICSPVFVVATFLLMRHLIGETSWASVIGGLIGLWMWTDHQKTMNNPAKPDPPTSVP